MDRRVAVYCRVSTDEQQLKSTIDIQLHACREHAEAIDAVVIKEYLDEAVSGTTPFDERPAGAELLADAEAKLFDAVLIYRLDRLAREMTQGLIAFKRLKKLGTPIVSVSETWDDSPTGGFIYREFLSIAELDRDLIVERTCKGRYAKVRAGAYLASFTPFGYVKEQVVITDDKNPKKCYSIHQLREHPEEAEIVRWIYQRCIAGAGLQEIADELQTRGVPTPNRGRKVAREWHHTTVYKILTSPRYIGQATYGGRPMPCLALVTETDQQEAIAALKRRSVHSGPKSRTFYALKGKLFCRRCNSLYYVSTMGAGKHAGTAVYRCGSRVRYRRNAPSHRGVYRTHWRADELEKSVLEFLQRAVAEPENLLREATTFEQRATSADTQQVDVEKRLCALLRNLDQQHERALKIAVRMGGDSLQVLDAEVARIARERADAETQISRLERTPDAEKFTHYANNLRRIARGIIEDRMEYTPLGHPLGPTYPELSKLIDRVWVEDDGSLTVEGGIPGTIPPPDSGDVTPNSSPDCNPGKGLTSSLHYTARLPNVSGLEHPTPTPYPSPQHTLVTENTPAASYLVKGENHR